MARWWTLAGMCMMVWALAAPVHAQGPIVFAEVPPPQPGPQFLPQGPGDCPPWNAFQSVPKIRNAWDETCTDKGYLPIKSYGGIGLIGWRRQGLGNGLIALAEPDNAALILPNPDTGVLGANVSPALHFSNVTTPFNLGVDFNIGCSWENHGVELAGFYQPRAGGSGQAAMPGQLAVPFYAFPAPFGFTGTNGLWLQNDIVEVQLSTQMGSLEANYRCSFGPYVQGILGARYFDVREKFSIRNDDDVLAAGARGVPVDIRRQATYSIDSICRIAGPQIGLDAEAPLGPYFWLGAFAKYMAGWDFTDVNQSLIRGDGFVGPSQGRSETVLSHVVELGGNVSLSLNPNIRLKLGYNGMWVLGIPVASQQVNFNPSGGPTRNNHGSIFFHGPTFRLEFHF